MIASSEERQTLALHAGELPSIILTPEYLADLEMLATGAFAPLHEFMGSKDYYSVVQRGRLADGTLFPAPVALSALNPGEASVGQEIAIRNTKNNLIAWMRIEEIFEGCHLAGELKVLELPVRHDFPDLRLSPAEVRARLAAASPSRVLAFQTQRPIHRSEEEMTKRACADLGAKLLVQVLAGAAQPGDIDHYARVRACKMLAAKHYDAGSTLLHLIPLVGRAGDMTLLQALVARNYGATHLLLHPEFGDPRAAAEQLDRHFGELGIRGVVGEPPAQKPEPWTRPETEEILAAARPPRHRQGFCIWLTGLPSAGKSTIAEVLATLLLEQGRQVTLLDGDVVRTHLSRGLGFSREDRDTNILRIGFVASEIVRHQGVVICAAVSPYRAARTRVREMMPAGQFVEVFVNTPLSVCEQRDVKGLYASARAGRIKSFTGVDDPYEAPLSPEITLETVSGSPAGNARIVFQYLQSEGFFRPEAFGSSPGW